MLTGTQVATDIYAMLNGSDLAKAISGKVYHEGMRPRGSGKEDAVIIFTTGLTGEVESGVVTINIYVHDIKPRRDGVAVINGKRVRELEALAGAWVRSLTAGRSNYLFYLQNAIYTEAEPSIDQHFVVIRLAYRHFTINN